MKKIALYLSDSYLVTRSNRKITIKSASTKRVIGTYSDINNNVLKVFKEHTYKQYTGREILNTLNQYEHSKGVITIIKE